MNTTTMRKIRCKIELRYLDSAFHQNVVKFSIAIISKNSTVTYFTIDGGLSNVKSCKYFAVQCGYNAYVDILPNPSITLLLNKTNPKTP